MYRLSLDFIDEAYLLSSKYPTEEKYEMARQLRRSSVSVALNIAEGSGKKTKKDFANFIRMAIGSLLESVANMKIAVRRKYITENNLEKSDPLVRELYFKLIALENNLRE
ncbi:MAG: four helix bundle protein [Candidatus Wildermuthbacteria bacterium]|nr:four helix bundle protein [Candidatus Wildermuthbacteria bacterium]